MGKDSFILYDNYAEQIEFLTDEQAGVLLKAIYAYRNGKPLPVMDSAVNMAFSFIRSQIDRDQERYDEICEKRRAAGATGGAPKGNQNAKKQPKQANAFDDNQNAKNNQNKQMQAKQPDNDNDTDNDLEKRNNKLFPKKEDGETVSPALSEETDLTAAQAGKAVKKKFIPPTREDVRAYAIQRGREDLAQPFFDFFDTGEWHDSNGKPVRNWKQKFLTWETHNPKKETQPQETTEPRKTAFFWEGD